MNKKVVISCGCIPARLDSVKFITNRFKGGLAFKTAKFLMDTGFDVTIVKWKYTDLPNNLSNVNVVEVLDVFEYYNWFCNNAENYDAFIMAGAVANLTPSNPYETKFPSHNYKVGERFNIEFEIAPRAIDIIKEKNPRATLIGYKLFDAKTDQELIEIATTTLNESKANIIFANTPKDAKNRKLALTLDGSIFEVSFNEHLELIKRAINLHYFKTKIIEEMQLNLSNAIKNKINLAKEVVKKFEMTINKFGTIAIKIDDDMFVTTSRGHKGQPVLVKKIDYINNIVYATQKATLNAPAIAMFLNGYDYVIHRHEARDGFKLDNYIFPGTIEECEAIKSILDNGSTIIEPYHGYISGYNFKKIDWNNYYNQFPKRYFNENPFISEMIEKYKGKDTLEVGGNSKNRTKFVLDKYAKKSSNSISYDDLQDNKFDLIVAENCINYLSEDEIIRLKKSLKKDGLFVANTFNSSPDFRIRDNEFVYSDNLNVNHYLCINEETVIYHNFFNRDINYYQLIGFDVKNYSNNSLLITYKKWSRLWQIFIRATTLDYSINKYFILRRKWLSKQKDWFLENGN